VKEAQAEQPRTYRVKWWMVLYMSVVHALSLVGLWMLVTDFSLRTLGVMGFCYWMSGLGITGGAHRLWSHRSYSARLPLRVFLAVAQSMANQGSIFHWARDHRVHHRYSETAADPHDASRGMFFAHMGWLFVEKDAKVVTAGNAVNVDDLWADPVVVFQERFKQFLMPFCCFVLPSLMAMVLAGDSYWRGFFICGVLRYVLILHATWLVNSAAHWWGSRPYDPNINPAENGIVAFITGGEGWHNFHHKWPADYATSELGWFGQYNPTALFLDACAVLGLVYNRRRHLVKKDGVGALMADENNHISYSEQKSH